jgi:hypothetical protein
VSGIIVMLSEAKHLNLADETLHFVQGDILIFFEFLLKETQCLLT